MKKKLAIALLIILFVMSLSALPVLAEVGKDCPGYGEQIINVQAEIGGMTVDRPYARDGYPRTDSLGPFQITASLIQDSGIATVYLVYHVEGQSEVTVPMIMDGLNLSYKIPKQRNLQYGEYSVHFYLRGVDDDGNHVWLEEVVDDADECPYNFGDPFYFKIFVDPPFVGNWRKVGDHPRDGFLQIHSMRFMSTYHGSYKNFYFLEVGPRGNITVYPEPAERLSWDRLYLHPLEYQYINGFLYEWTTGTWYRKASSGP